MFFDDSNKLVCFFLSKLIIHLFFIQLSFAFLNDLRFVSASRANIFISVINNDINVFVFLQNPQCRFLLVGQICDLFIPKVFWKTSSSLSRTLKQNVLTFLYSYMQFHELLIRKDLSRTKVPGVFSTKKNILLFSLRLKSSKLAKLFFHCND